jgi:hypothetical protein
MALNTTPRPTIRLMYLIHGDFRVKITMKGRMEVLKKTSNQRVNCRLSRLGIIIWDSVTGDMHGTSLLFAFTFPSIPPLPSIPHFPSHFLPCFSPAMPNSSIACISNAYFHSPGRHFASQQLKLLLAYIAMRYDIQPLPSRPQNPWINNTIGPPVGARLRVHRRRS